MSNPARSRDSNSRLVHSNADLFFTGVAGFGLSVLALIASRWSGVAACGVFFAGSLALAEFAARSRRMAVSSTLLFFTYYLSINYALDNASSLLREQFPEDDLAPSSVLSGLAATAYLAAPWLYWVRYRVPAAAGAGMVIVILWLTSLPPLLFESLGWERVLFLPLGDFVILTVGIAVIATATLLDLRDPERRTFDSDIAFWLHLVAAPIVVGSVIASLADALFFTRLETSRSWLLLEPIVLLASFILISVFSLVLNRSAYFVFSCPYLFLWWASTQVKFWHSSDADFKVFFIAIVIAVGLMMKWRTARLRVLQCLPAGFSARLPAPDEQPRRLDLLAASAKVPCGEERSLWLNSWASCELERALLPSPANGGSFDLVPVESFRLDPSFVSKRHFLGSWLVRHCNIDDTNLAEQETRNMVAHARESIGGAVRLVVVCSFGGMHPDRFDARSARIRHQGQDSVALLPGMIFPSCQSPSIVCPFTKTIRPLPCLRPFSNCPT